MEALPLLLPPGAVESLNNDKASLQAAFERPVLTLSSARPWCLAYHARQRQCVPAASLPRRDGGKLRQSLPTERGN